MVNDNWVYILRTDRIVKYSFDPGYSEIILPDKVESFDYNAKTKDIYYETVSGIFKYNESNKTVTALLSSGIEPKVSPDNSYLACRNKTVPNKLEILDMNTNQIKQISFNTKVVSYCFSPDSKYIAILKPEGFHLFSKFKYESYEVLLWDHKNNKKYVVLRDLDKMCNIDWQ